MRSRASREDGPTDRDFSFSDKTSALTMWTTRTKNDLLDEYLPQFNDPQRCRDSLQRYLSSSRVLDEQRCRDWLERDRVQDQARGLPDPENYVIGPSNFELNGCYHCYGKRLVRQDVPATHIEFGRLLPCPACRGKNGDRSAHCPKCANFSAGTVADRPEHNRCSRCGAYEHELAAEGCVNPGWHLPNARGQRSFDPAARRDYVAELTRHLTGR